MVNFGEWIGYQLNDMLITIIGFRLPKYIIFIPKSPILQVVCWKGVGKWHATFFKLFYNKIWIMQFQYESLPRETPSYADSKFHNQSTTANFGLTDDGHLFAHNNIESNNSEETPLEICKNSKSIDRYQGEQCLPIEKEIGQITYRFSRIQQVLLQHSERESKLHEKVYGFKQMPIDWLQLSPDLTNKVSIVQDLRHLVNLAEQQAKGEEIVELLESKFQEYYLERHYGGLRCEINDLSIQQRGEQEPPLQSLSPKQIDYESMAFGYAQQSSSYDNSSASGRQLQGLSSVQRSDQSLQYINLRADRRKPVSRIGFTSLVNESKLTYTEECCQTVEQHFSITVEVPRFIEVQIPLVVYKVKEKVITYDESDLEAPYKDIDQIIDKYSRPYEELYIDSGKQIKDGVQFSELQSIQQQAGPSLQVGSIMLNSNVEASRQNGQMTEVELSYSQLPEQQLLLNSFAQIGSLITETPIQSNTIIITQKLNSRSILEKFEQSERLLNEQNIQLKQKVAHLESQLQETQKKLRQATVMGKKLSDRLEEQIQQGVYLSKKLDQLDAELLQERVECLTRLNDCKDNKIHNMQTQIAQQARQVDSLKCQLEALKIENQKTEQLLVKREQQMAQLVRQLQQREQELCLFNSCQDDIIKIVSETEISLKGQIQKLQQQKTEMKEQLTEFQKRVESQGINLQYDEAKEIQGIIQSRQHVFNVQLKEATDKYEQIINKYKQELDEVRLQLGQALKQLAEARQQIRILNQLSHAKSELHDTCTTVKEKRLSESYLNEFEALIGEYDRELQAKDTEILQLKTKLKQVSPKIVCDEDYQERLSKAIVVIEGISSQLERERQERMRITERLVVVDKMLTDSKKAIESDQLQKYEDLVQQLSDRLEKMMAQNQNLRQKLQQAKKLSQEKADNAEVQVLRKQVQKLKKVNSKLKKYTVEIESELTSISGMNRCQSHKLIINNLIKERDYFVEMLTNKSTK